MMQIEPRVLDERDLYKILTGCVLPRPIAWVSTVDMHGVRNVAPFSFFNVISSNPPAVSIAISYAASHDHRKDTLRNIADTGVFVVNIVNEELAAAMNLTSANYPQDVDEFIAAGLTAIPGVCITAPRVGESPISFECTVHTLVPVGQGPGSSTLVVGIIQLIHIYEGLIDERYRVDLAKLRPIGRLTGPKYAYVHETFDLPRPIYNSSTGTIE